MAPKDASAVRSLEPDESLGVYGKMMRYGGIVHEISSLAKAIVSLSGPDSAIRGAVQASLKLRDPLHHVTK